MAATPNPTPAQTQQLRRKRGTMLAHIIALTQTPLLILSFVWLGLLIIDLTRGLHGWRCRSAAEVRGRARKAPREPAE